MSLRSRKRKEEKIIEKSELTTINVSLKKYQKDKIIQKAQSNGYKTISAFIIDSAEKQNVVNMNTEVYRELVIQVKKVGLNINQIIRDIRFDHYFTDNQILEMENLLKDLNKYLEDERKEIKSSIKYIEKTTPKTLKNIRDKTNFSVPANESKISLLELLNKELLNFINLLEKNNWEKVYKNYIYNFISNFDFKKYRYKELAEFQLSLSETVTKTNQKLMNPEKKMSNDDFIKIRNILNKYRK